MKKYFTLQLAALALLLVGSAPSVQAQQEQNTQPQIIVIQKVKNDDGTVTVTKKRMPADERANEYLKNLDFNKESQVDIEILTDEHQIRFAPDSKLHFNQKDLEIRTDEFFMKGLDKEMIHLGHHFGELQHTNKAFLGIYPATAPGEAGVLVENIVLGTPAEAAGLASGDVIVSLGDQTLTRQGDLTHVLSQHNPKETVTIVYLRNGQTVTTTATLAEKQTGYSWTVERDPCKVFIGVTVGSRGPSGQGVRVNSVIGDTPAEKHGVQAGDVIIALDDVFVNSHMELLRERNKHEPGEWFTLSIDRNGQTLDIDAQFKQCEEETEEPIEPVIEEVIVEEVPVLKEDPDDPVPTSVDNTLELLDLAAFPNPTYAMVNLQFRGEAVPTTVRITDVSGKVVYEEVLKQFDGFYSNAIDLYQRSSPGVHFVTIQQGDQVRSEQIVLMARA